MNDDKGRARKEVIMGYFKVVVCILSSSAKQNHLNQDNLLSYEDMKSDLHKYVVLFLY
jgi:hypothetical protein